MLEFWVVGGFGKRADAEIGGEERPTGLEGLEDVPVDTAKGVLAHFVEARLIHGLGEKGLHTPGLEEKDLWNPWW